MMQFFLTEIVARLCVSFQGWSSTFPLAQLTAHHPRCFRKAIRQFVSPQFSRPRIGTSAGAPDLGVIVTRNLQR